MGGRRITGDCAAGWVILQCDGADFTLLACGARYCRLGASLDADLLVLDIAVEIFWRLLDQQHMMVPGDGIAQMSKNDIADVMVGAPYSFCDGWSALFVFYRLLPFFLLHVEFRRRRTCTVTT